jgi:hypothetical protein
MKRILCLTILLLLSLSLLNAKSRIDFDKNTNDKSIHFIKSHLKPGMKYIASEIKDSDLRIIILGDYSYDPVVYYEFKEDNTYIVNYIKNFNYDKIKEKPIISGGNWRIEKGILYLKPDNSITEYSYMITYVKLEYVADRKIKYACDIWLDKQTIYGDDGFGKFLDE